MANRTFQGAIGERRCYTTQINALKGTIEMIKFNGYGLSSDDMNITLHEKRICSHGKNKGKEIYPTIGYFSTIKNALEFLIEHHIKKSELKDLIAIDEKIKELKSMLSILPDLLR